jgi:hypothetical protein
MNPLLSLAAGSDLSTPGPTATQCPVGQVLSYSDSYSNANATSDGYAHAWADSYADT